MNELRDELAVAGVVNPLWFEVPKSKMAPKRVREALAGGAEIVFVWGGDGMVQRCADAMAGSDAALAIIPAGTANLFASNLEIPKDVRAAIAVGLDGHRRRLDVGQINGERFVVMAGAGLDALMIRDADGSLKKHLGRAAYIFTGAKNIGLPRVRAHWVKPEVVVTVAFIERTVHGKLRHSRLLGIRTDRSPHEVTRPPS